MKPYIIIITLVMLLSFTCLIGCFSTTYMTNTGHTWTQDELYAYWDGFNDIASMFSDLKTKGYIYGNELNDNSYVFDTPTPVLDTMTRGYTNCYGWSFYLTEYIKYKKLKSIRICDSYKLVLLRNGLRWHYIVTAEMPFGQVYEQSNMDIGSTPLEQTILDNWYNRGYQYQKVIETFEF